MSSPVPSMVPDTEQSASDYAQRLEALLQAVQVGIADIEAGAFDSFDSPQALSAHLKALADQVLNEKHPLP